VNPTGLPASEPDVAVTAYDPTLLPSVSVLLACPLPFVVVVVVLNDCPTAPPGIAPIANVTLVPVTGFPPASVTVTTNGEPSAVLIWALWPFPDVRLIVAAAPTVAVAVNPTGLPASEPDVAVTAYDPTLLPSVNVLLAWPFTSVVVTVALNDCPAAPTGVVPIAKITFVPLTGFPPASRTVTTNGEASAVLITAFWLFPEVRLIVAALPVVAVAVNVTGLPASPPDVAVTVYDPTLLPSVSVLLACPLPFVVVVVVVNDCPVAPEGVVAIANVTLTPGTGLLPASVTVTTNGAPSAVLIFAF